MDAELSPLTASGIRFAPSPTGRFHIGNLRTAWISARLADALSQPWIIRIEDIDKPRVVDDAWSNPLTGQRADLEKLGLNVPPHRSELLYFQSDRYVRHRLLFDKARRDGLIYACDCSRQNIKQSLTDVARAPHEPEPEYSGHCRHKKDGYSVKESLAWRWKQADESGRYDSIIARTSGLDAADFTPGYHWACAIDDADGDFAVLVRAWDLAPAERIQSVIRAWVNPETSAFVYHTALITQDDGRRLEKRTRGVTLTELLERGETVDSIVEKFRSSFNFISAVDSITRFNQEIGDGDRIALIRETLLGEAEKSLGLSDLGF